ncbi:hypothetical protein D3C72_1041890 [compost metagenome]
MLRQGAGGVQQHLGRLFLAFGVDDLGAPFAFGLGLAGDDADHAFIQVDVLDFHVRHLDAPCVGLRIQDLLHVVVQLVALGQHFVQVVLAQDRAQGRLRQFTGGLPEVLYLDHGAFRIDDAKVDDGVHFDRYVVA